MSAKATITRSSGLSTGFSGFIAGGGYSGMTKELDDTVAKQATMLAEAFGRDVEIRFNSDRRSGGAWLKDDLPGFAGNAQAGFTARIAAKPPKGKTYHQWLNELGEEHGWGPGMDKVLREAPQEVAISTYIKEAVLKDSSIANSGNLDSRYASQEHSSLREGIAFLKKHVDRSKLNPYTGSQPVGEVEELLPSGTGGPRRRSPRGSSRSRSGRSPQGIRGVRS